jgi:hypothetical protein
MTRATIAVLILTGGCSLDDSLHQHELARRGLSQDDLEAPPGDNEIRARILSDVRTVWLPEAELERGMKECPVLRFDGVRPVCAADRTVMKVFTLRNDSPDRQYPVHETTYFCPTETVYWYHYEGGEDRRDTWLGPRKIKLRLPEKSADH